jgi:DNA-binding IclR family transcriptional regulator
MATGAQQPEGRAVGSVARAIAVLETLAAHPEGLGVNELGRRLGVNASSASRLLATLEQGGLVERDALGPYRLGLGLLRLAHAALDRLDVRELARPLLAELARSTGETATLSLPETGPGAAVTVDFVRSPASVASTAVLGRPTVPHATAVGKVVLAFRPGGLPPQPLAVLTDRTITDAGALERAIAEVRGRGWAEALGEREPDLHAVAVPVAGPGGELVAVLGVQGPAGRLGAAPRRAARVALLAAAAELERRLGGGGASVAAQGA